MRLRYGGQPQNTIEHTALSSVSYNIIDIVAVGAYNGCYNERDAMRAGDCWAQQSGMAV